MSSELLVMSAPASRHCVFFLARLPALATAPKLADVMRMRPARRGESRRMNQLIELITGRNQMMGEIASSSSSGSGERPGQIHTLGTG